ncbi:MAG: alpha/beta fold hydrolase [Brasilonema octagenarum HA4186-MV1]|jgi:pimeloyl-ACP methyl ester carboxylesterase|uniref:Alpha/beta hydrolase n=1 Tax=Brasilonema octagenarum UFV-OR1 TaxID=417115 RepID=A0ABX1M9I2_9CYAN|nr:alpha/beta hydrolase [Brasilonema octagenarum]MBW4624660.1 alpha/beta fold hydrolase [Brasilonema octagenarum HA4186-MV1]NMF65239.1 alpha/beta hydrolase [Brasilonema octagenarum UFV-OR1]
MDEFQRKTFKTSDGAELSYISAGRGKSIVLIHGWSQSAQQFKYQISAFAQRYHVIAVDLRGHGESEKVTYGYRISRLSKDIQELISFLQLEKPHLLAHSMGCAVVWSYLDLFGQDEIDRLVLVDQSPLYTSRPHWSSQEMEEAGAIVTSEQLNEMVYALESSSAEEVTRNTLASMVTNAMSTEQFEWIVQCNFRCPRQLAATLLYNQFHMDWRDQIVKIRKPALIIAGRKSVIPWRSQVWINKSIPDSELEIFEETEGGGHFMFIENPEKFNRRVLQFLEKA